jgi:hypothetical protein
MSIITPLGQDLAATEASGKRRSCDPLLVTRCIREQRVPRATGAPDLALLHPPTPDASSAARSRPSCVLKDASLSRGSASGKRRAPESARLRKPPANVVRPRAPSLHPPTPGRYLTHPAPRSLLHPPNPEPAGTGSLPVGRPLFPWDAPLPLAPAHPGSADTDPFPVAPSSPHELRTRTRDRPLWIRVFIDLPKGLW